LKRGRSNSTTLAQRVPLGPGRGQTAPPVTNAVNARVAPSRSRISVPSKRASRPVSEQIQEGIEARDDDIPSEMDVEIDAPVDYDDDDLISNEREVEVMVGVNDEVDEEENDLEVPQVEAKPLRIWPDVATEQALRYQKEVQAIRERFEDEIDMYDTTMVSEYAEEIFEYMCDLEVGQLNLD